MNTLKFDVYKNTLKRRDGFNPVLGEKNYTKIKCYFTADDWDKCTAVTANFIASKDNITKSTVSLTAADKTAVFDIPSDLEGDKIYISLTGSYSDESGNTVTLNTNIVGIDRNKGMLPQDKVNIQLFEQIITLFNNYSTALNEKVANVINEIVTARDTFSALGERLDNLIPNKSDVIGTEHIQDDAILTSKIQDEAVDENKLSHNVKNLLYISETVKWENALTDSITGGFFFNASGKKVVSDKYSGALISVEAGQQLKITARTSSANPQLVCFYSDYDYIEGTATGETYTLIDTYGSSSALYSDEAVTVPNGAKWAGINSYVSGSSAVTLAVKKAVMAFDKSVKEAIADINNEVSGLFPNAKTDTDTIIVPSLYKNKFKPNLAVKIDTASTARCLYIDGNYLYHTGNNYFAVSKVDISNPLNPNNVTTVGGHAKCYPRGLSVANGYMYVAYRDNAAATKTSFGDTDVGGYLDIIKMSNFTPAKAIAYSRKQYDPGDGKGVRYFGKAHYTATHGSGLLCVTQQMGGWLLYDISTSPSNPTLVYEHDNREQIYIDNVGDKGYAEFQQPCFFEHNNTVYLAIAGYDRDLVNIYDLSTPSNPQCVKSINIRTLWNGNETDKRIHTMGIVNSGDYLYLTVAPYPNITDKTMSGIAVLDISNGVENLSCKLMSIPHADMCTANGGEPAPASISVCNDKLITDNGNNLFCMWDITDKVNPQYCGTYPSNEIASGVFTANDMFAVGLTSPNNKICVYGYNGVADIVIQSLIDRIAKIEEKINEGK